MMIKADPLEVHENAIIKIVNKDLLYGKFLDKCSMEEYIEKCSQFGEQAGMTNEQMKEYCTKVFPTLKRWKKAE